MDELEISGQRYLSTRRAAKEHKYTSDYVGQLIRGGKVVGKKVGRSWYVEEKSLNAYLSGEKEASAPVLKVTPVKKEEPKHEPAPEPVAAATPAPVEVFVPKVEEQKPEAVVAASVEEKTFEPVIIKTKTLEEHHIPIRTPAPQKEKAPVGLRYVVDEAPSLPEIKRKEAITSSPAVAVRKIEEAVQEEEDNQVEIIPNKKIGVFAFGGLAVAALITLSATAYLSATLNTRIVVEEGQVASVGYTFQ